MSFRVPCSGNYYDPNCSSFCEPLEDMYTCDSRGRTVCVQGGGDPATNYMTCFPNWEPKTNCTTCSSFYDIQTDCTRCVVGRDINTNCITCLPGYDPSTNCMQYISTWCSISNNTTRYVYHYILYNIIPILFKLICSHEVYYKNLIRTFFTSSRFQWREYYLWKLFK